MQWLTIAYYSITKLLSKQHCNGCIIFRYSRENQAVFDSGANQPGSSNASTAIARQRCFSDPAPIQQQDPSHSPFPSHNQFFSQQHPLPHSYFPVSQPQSYLMANQIPQPAQIRYSCPLPLSVAPQQAVKRGRPGRKPKNSGRQSPKQVIYREKQQQGRKGRENIRFSLIIKNALKNLKQEKFDWTQSNIRNMYRRVFLYPSLLMYL